jgi:putative ABC transport system permease protein
MIRELKVVLRKLGNNPGFTLVAVLTLALGIGANAAIFSVVHGVMLKPLPYPDAEELYGLWHSAPGLGIPEFEQSNTTYTLYRELSQSFQEIGMSDGDFSMSLTSEGEPVRIESAGATASLFDVLGVKPYLGRTFTEDEDDTGAPDVVILGYRLWRGRFGGAPDILGRKITLNGTPWEVIGVMPDGFSYPGEDTQLWVPHVIDRADLGKANFSFEALGRLKPGIRVEAVDQELTQILKRMPDVYPGEISARMIEEAQITAHVNPLLEDIVGDVSQVLWILFGTVGGVLLIACANVANLFLVRAEGKQRELALRSALGASRTDLMKYFLTESFLLAGLGGVLGLALSYAGTRALIATSPENVPRLGEVGLHPSVLAFTAAITLLAGLLFGLIPLVRYRQPNLTRGINEGSLRAGSGRETHRMRSVLVGVQVAFALVLLVMSGLMARSFWELRGVHPGFRKDHLLVVRLSLPRANYPESTDAASFYSRLMDRLATLPGVRGVGGVNNFPMTDGQSNNGVVLEDYPLEPDELPPLARTNYASAGYFETVGIPLLEGRTFERRDHEEVSGAVVISKSLAERHWPGQSVIGRRLVPGLPDSSGGKWYSIVGVVDDVRDDGLEQDPTPMIYYPLVGFGGKYDDWSIRTMSVVMRTDSEPSSLSGPAREAIWALDPRLPLISIRTGEAIVSRSMARTSYTMILLGIAAGVALFLGSIGIYGVVSYIVSQRTREIGVRMALGAARRDVSRMVVRQGLTMALVGVAAGVALAIAATRWIATLLYGVSETDPLTFVAVSMALLAVTALASYLPARRAASVSPLRSLRYE